jgi:hypothetical protein
LHRVIRQSVHDIYPELVSLEDLSQRHSLEQVYGPHHESFYQWTWILSIRKDSAGERISAAQKHNMSIQAYERFQPSGEIALFSILSVTSQATQSENEAERPTATKTRSMVKEKWPT